MVWEICLHLPNAVKALALTELVLCLPCALFGLLEAAHRVGLLPVAEVDVAQVVVGAVEVLQQLPFSWRAQKTERESCPSRDVIVNRDAVTFKKPLLRDEDASADEIAATLWLAEVIADQTQIEK